MNKIEKPKVVIVGAGAAGLAAARHLADNCSDWNVTVLEANSERYGGRIWSYNAPGYTERPFELGGMWLHGGTAANHPVGKLCLKHGIRTMLHDEGRSDMIDIYDLKGRKYTTSDFETIENAMKLLDKLRIDTIDRETVDVTMETAFKSLSEKYSADINVQSIELFGIPQLESFEGGTKEEISLLHSNGFDTSTKGEGQYFEGDDLVIPEGYVTFLDKLIIKGNPFELVLDRNVTSITVNEESNEINIETVNKRGDVRKYSADHVIVTVSLGVLKRNGILFKPQLTAEHLEAIEKIGFGNKIKVVLIFDHVFWPNIEVMGTEECEPVAFPLFFVNMHKINGTPALMATIASQAIKMATDSNDEYILQRVLNRLEIIVGTDALKKAKLIFYKIVEWKKQPHIDGAYSFAKIGMTLKHTYDIRKPLGKWIFFAGEHTTFPEKVYGTVHGAYLSGIRAAEEIMQIKHLASEQIQPVKYLPK